MRLLVADDSSLYRTMLQRLLEPWGYEVVLAADGHDAQRFLDGGDAPRLALLDCLLPGPSVFELCERIRARAHNSVYTILLSPDNQQSNVLRAFKLGADDYLCKPLNRIELRTRLRIGEIILQNRHEVTEAPETLKVEAAQDASLQIWNREAILDLLSTELSRARRSQTSLSVLITDLDFLNRLHRNNGHSSADRVRRAAAEEISRAVRHCDHVGRYEGEQFLVVLPNCTAEEAREVADRVWHQINQEPLTHEFDVSVSFGLSQWHPDQEAEELLHQADVALQRAKQNGRCLVEVQTAVPDALDEISGDASHSQRELRRILRSGLNRRLQVRAFHQGRPTLLHGRIRNISQDGIGAVIPCSLQIDEHVALTFAMERSRECTVSAVVRHCQGLRSGFQFISIEPSLRDAIARICG
jgi:diguanylate cyclase (GGDEF)-like protein